MSEEGSEENSDYEIAEEDLKEEDIAEKIISAPILTRFEFASAVITRSEQIANGSPYFVLSPGLVKDATLKIAIREIIENKCPLKVCREVLGKKEFIKVNDLKKLKKYLNLNDVIFTDERFDVKGFIENLKKNDQK